MGTNYWKSKVLPKIKKVFEKNGTKKAAAAEACKTFDDSKEQYSKEFEEKKNDLQAKVVQVYEASSVEIKNLIKEPKDAGLKKHSAAVQKFLDELVKIEFPGSKPVSEACSKFGAAYVSGPVFFVLEKVSTYVVTEEEKKEEEAPAATTEATTTTSTSEEKPSGEEVKEKEIVAQGQIKEEEKKEEEKKEEKTAEKTTEPAAPAATTEPTKVEDAPAAEPPKP